MSQTRVDRTGMDTVTGIVTRLRQTGASSRVEAAMCLDVLVGFIIGLDAAALADASAAGAPEAVVAAMLAHFDDTGGASSVEAMDVHVPGCAALECLLLRTHDHTGNALRALRAGAMRLAPKLDAEAAEMGLPCSNIVVELLRATVEHDAAPCAHAATCARCEELRRKGPGAVCGAPGCGCSMGATAASCCAAAAAKRSPTAARRTRRRTGRRTRRRASSCELALLRQAPDLLDAWLHEHVLCAAHSSTRKVKGRFASRAQLRTYRPRRAAAQVAQLVASSARRVMRSPAR
jgi:hypothetical protein